MKKFKSQIIKSVRAERGISQEQMAKKLGISRQSYLGIEQGKRDFTLEEASVVSDMLGVSLEQLAEGVIPDDKKYKQMIFAFIQYASDNDGKIPKTKLAKLLYLSDFGWFYDHLISMSGMPYRRIKYGPVPDPYFRIIEEAFEGGELNVEKTDKGAMLISASRAGSKMPSNLLNKDEIAFIKKVAKKWKSKRTKEIVAFTHNQLPYQVCSEGEVIPYELITQEDPEYVY